MRSLLIALFLLVAIASVGVFFWMGRPSLAPPIAAAPTAAIAPPSAVDTRVEPVGLQAISREAAPHENLREATPAPLPPLLQGIEEGAVVAVGVDLTWKYGREARERLLDELTRIESELQAAEERAFGSRFAASGFTTHAIAANDARAIDDIVESLKSDSELCCARLVVGSSAGPASTALRPSAVQIACLPRTEFEHIYALVDERDWLCNFIERSAPAEK